MASRGRVLFSIPLVATALLLATAVRAPATPVRAWVVLGSTGQVLRGGKGITSVTLGTSNATSTSYCLKLAKDMHSGVVSNTVANVFRTEVWVPLGAGFDQINGCPAGTTAVVVVHGNVNSNDATFLQTTVWLF